MYCLIRAEPLTNYKLRLVYTDQARFDVDIRPLIDKGGVFAPLADCSIFDQANVGEGGRYVEWPGEVDLCADALRLEVQQL
jgi:hypothetical protein